MGCLCEVTEEADTRRDSRANGRAREENTLQSNHDAEKFKDFEELGRVKKIPSYKCLLPYDELIQLREDFWKSKTKNRRVWAAIREICESDHETAVQLLEATYMACIDGTLRSIFLLNNVEYRFNVPNFCITDPLFEKDFDSLKKINDIKEEEITLIIYYLEKNKDCQFKETTKTQVKVLKTKFAQSEHLNMKQVQIRFLFKGHELQDDHLLFYYNIENMSKIQVLVRKLNDD